MEGFMDIKKYLPVLKLTGFFEEFTDEMLLKLFAKKPWTIKTYEKDSFIHMENEKCKSWDIILSGRTIIKKIDENGNILTLAEFGAGDNIGGNTLFSKYPFFPMSVFAKSKSIILHIKKDFVLELCHSSRNFLIRFLESNSDKAAVLSNKIKSISLKSIRASLTAFINYEYCSQKSKKIRLQMTKKDLAERLGIQRTSLSRELSKMKNDGLIDFDIHSITIVDHSIIKNS